MVRAFLALLAVLASAAPATAQFEGPSSSTRAQASTVAEVGTARLGSYVTLTGNIIERQRGDYFTFRDSTGTIRVEIQDEIFARRAVKPETKVRITGEIEPGVTGRYVSVDRLEILP